MNKIIYKIIRLTDDLIDTNLNKSQLKIVKKIRNNTIELLIKNKENKSGKVLKYFKLGLYLFRLYFETLFIWI